MGHSGNVSLAFRSSANKDKTGIVNHIYALRRLEEPPVNSQGHTFPKPCPNTSLTHTFESGCCHFCDSTRNYRQVNVKRHYVNPGTFVLFSYRHVLLCFY